MSLSEEFQQIYHQYQPRLYRFIFKQVASVQEAEDVCQEVFALFYQQRQEAHNEEQEAPVGPWLFGIARNLLRNRYRRHHRWLASLKTLLFEPPPTIRTPEQLLEQSHTRRALQGKLARLPEIERSLIVLFTEGYTSEEMAASVGMTPAAARKRLQRAKEKLKHTLQQVP